MTTRKQFVHKACARELALRPAVAAGGGRVVQQDQKRHTRELALRPAVVHVRSFPPTELMPRDRKEGA